MVRTSTSDDKEPSRKRSTPRTKAVVSGVWPCKINGCNKQFAREADLKRHQRTTKLHSMPNTCFSACPQCDATFTRTDALRRHQKSRHNGVVIEPSDDSKDDAEEDGSSGSQSESRSATPSSKGKERANVPPISTVQYTLPPERPGPSSYYRQHTLTDGSHVPRPPVVDPHYPQIGLPTSSTRLNMSTHWGYPHPWPDGIPQQLSYQQIYYPPHYRPNGAAQPLGQPPSHAGINQHQQSASTIGAKSTSPPLSCPPQSTHRGGASLDNGTSRGQDDVISITTIDPSLTPTDSNTLTEQQVLEITQAAMKVFEAQEAEQRSSVESQTKLPSTTGVGPPGVNGNTVSILPGGDKQSLLLHEYTGMDHLLTEDGEPMLNPAELLTQESLAESPPP